MKFYQAKVEMLGFMPLATIFTAESKSEAELIAVREFMALNAIDQDDDTTEAELVKFYAPKVKRTK